MLRVSSFNLGDSLNYSVLHINCNLIFTSFYNNLYNSICDLGISQSVWVPHKNYHNPGVYNDTESIKYFFTGYQDALDRIFFHRKIKKGIKNFEAFEKLKLESVIHAHTLFSDGALAYEISRKYGTPYVVTVRNTDLNVFWKYFPHLRNYARQIVQNASSVIFLGASYKDRMIKKLFPANWSEVEEKAHVIPNGLDPFWLSHPPEKRKIPSSEIRVLFVGKFTGNKNIETLVDACSSLLECNENLKLRLIGARKKEDFAYYARYEWIEVFHFCEKKEILAEHYRWADVFAMPSFNETFGLVYAEALSQGTPVIFTKGQGFDGWINEGHCGYGVSPKNVKEIARKINALHQQHFEDECISSSSIFDWKVISEKYVKIYEKALLRH